MSADVTTAAAAVPDAAAPLHPRHYRAGGPTLAVIAVIVLLYHDTVWAMVLLWSRSQTFAHGFTVLPVCAWLVWRQRHRLAATRQRPAAAGFILLPCLGLAWLLAFVANVQVVAQYAVTAMIPAAVVAMLGWHMARRLAFPLAYLFLAVPFGEVFIPPLIEFTARFTVGALQLTGVPVFRENNNFSIPSGNWSVVEACSGLRYVIASLALGALYAYLNYRSTARRLAFIAVALLLPIVANGVRAYLIVMLGHWSGMRLAVGVDHLIYGWLFFGLVSLLLFWTASLWRERPAPVLIKKAGPSRPAARGATLAATAACIALAACWPLLAALTATPTAGVSAGGQLRIAPARAYLPLPVMPDAWRAPHAGKPLEAILSYAGPLGPLTLQVAWYARQNRDDELLAHVPKPYGDTWLLAEDSARTVHIGGQPRSVQQLILQRGSARLLVWRWYRQGGVDTGNAFLIKLLLAKAKLFHTQQGGADIIVSAPYDESTQAPEAALQAFLSAMLPSINQGLNDVANH